MLGITAFSEKFIKSCIKPLKQQANLAQSNESNPQEKTVQQSKSEGLTQGSLMRGTASLDLQNQIVEALVTISQNQKALMNEVQQQAQTNRQIMTQVQSLQKEFEHYKSEINNLKQNKNSESSNELSTNVEELSKFVLESKTVVTAEGKTVLASDEVLRKEVEKLRNDVTLMMDAVKKQRMTLNGLLII